MEEIESRRESWRPRRRSDQLTPGPSVLVSRGLLYLTLCLVLAASIWTAFAQLDVVVEARGRVGVRGEPIELTAPQSALVVAVPVHVGQHVEAGDIVVIFDAIAQLAEAERIRVEVETLREEAARHRESALRLDQAQAALIEALEASEGIVELHERGLARIRALEAQGVIAAVRVDEQERHLLEARDLHAQRKIELAQQDREIGERRRLAGEAESRIGGLRGRLEEVLEYTARATLRAPVGGTIVRLAVRHPGTVLDTDEAVVVLAPDGQPLQALVEIPNASMRQLRRGITTRIELDAFPREDYGYISGALLDIEPDSDNEGNYRAVISLESAELAGSDVLSQIKPGMLVSTQILTERRRVIEYLLRPFDRLSGSLSVVQ